MVVNDPEIRPEGKREKKNMYGLASPLRFESLGSRSSYLYLRRLIFRIKKKRALSL
jgi:hypothetical protein